MDLLTGEPETDNPTVVERILHLAHRTFSLGKTFPE